MKTGCLRYRANLASGRQVEGIAKHIFTPTNTWEASTYYVRDAQGNVMATYLHTTEEGEYDGQPVTLATYTVSERHIYGSSRLGMDTTRIELLAYEPPPADRVYTTNADDRIYELTNHLGNVLATFTARKLPTTDNGEVTGFMAHVTSLSDYYPFGSALTGRMVDHNYRYGFQGQETDAEYFNGAVSFKYRVHDARLGRFLSIDPLAPDYPWNSTYAFSENRVVDSHELEGLERIYFMGGFSDGTYQAVLEVVSSTNTYQAVEDRFVNHSGGMDMMITEGSVGRKGGVAEQFSFDLLNQYFGQVDMPKPKIAERFESYNVQFTPEIESMLYDAFESGRSFTLVVVNKGFLNKAIGVGVQYSFEEDAALLRASLSVIHEVIHAMRAATALDPKSVGEGKDHKYMFTPRDESGNYSDSEQDFDGPMSPSVEHIEQSSVMGQAKQEAKEIIQRR